MTHKEFRIMQRNMDESGMLTAIKTIRIQIKPYKYRYEVILNGAIIKTCKARITAKNHLIRLFQDKMTLHI